MKRKKKVFRDSKEKHVFIIIHRELTKKHFF